MKQRITNDHHVVAVAAAVAAVAAAVEPVAKAVAPLRNVHLSLAVGAIVNISVPVGGSSLLFEILHGIKMEVCFTLFLICAINCVVHNHVCLLWLHF